jgi:hypothetical protein
MGPLDSLLPANRTLSRLHVVTTLQSEISPWLGGGLMTLPRS